jgi:hypothetical protein
METINRRLTDFSLSLAFNLYLNLIFLLFDFHNQLYKISIYALELSFLFLILLHFKYLLKNTKVPICLFLMFFVQDHMENRKVQHFDILSQ